MKYNIIDIAKGLNIKEVINENYKISTLLTDSRKLNNPAETLFFALVSEKGDGHTYIEELYYSGVRNFVVSKTYENPKETNNANNFLRVTDPLIALQQIATSHRQKFNIPVVGITGSNGKTIVKEWLYQLLNEEYYITRSPRSYNSQIGVPLSVWELNEDTTLGIFEAGISQPNEMSNLQKIIDPTIGILTKLGDAHQENFASLEEKCREKMKLFINCDVTIYNIDNLIVASCAKEMIADKKSFTWSRLNSACTLFIKKEKKKENRTIIEFIFDNYESYIEIPFIDDASIENAISSLSLLLYLGKDPEFIRKQMIKLEPVAMRLDVRKGRNNTSIINDSYNSDINSIKIALDFQNQRKVGSPLKKRVIISDIQQTGIDPRLLYIKVSELLDEYAVDQIIGVGPEISANADKFGTNSCFFLSTEDLINSGICKTFNNELILLKGARIFHFENILETIEEIAHETKLEVNLDAIIHNFNFYNSLLKKDVKMICMVKANGYGCGAVEIAKTLQHHRCDYLAVAVAEEGIELRREGITTPIIVLNPEVSGFEAIVNYNLEPEIYNFRILEKFIKEAQRRGITNYPIHLKIDTGMHRLGFLKKEISKLGNILKSQQCLKVISIFSHLAASESWKFDEFTNEQADNFIAISEALNSACGYKIGKHILNSAGIDRFKEIQMDFVRLGIGLYGISNTNRDKLKNACSLKSSILQIKEIDENSTVGYGRKEVVDKTTKIATIRIGYADGLSRQFGNRKRKVLVRGELAEIVGNICMDLTMIDVTHIKNISEGDEVTLFGEDLSITEIADSIQTIPYELLTSISPRVKRVYTKE